MVIRVNEVIKFLKSGFILNYPITIITLYTFQIGTHRDSQEIIN
jgi:hypothetical protein